MFDTMSKKCLRSSSVESDIKGTDKQFIGSPLELDCLERLFSMRENGSYKIATVLTVKQNKTKLNHLRPRMPDALKVVFNRHPRMRMKQSKENPLQARICPPIQSYEIISLQLLRFIDTENIDWADFVSKEIQIPFDRTNSFPYYLVILFDCSQDQHSRLVLFADHYASDGKSGLIILNDFLTVLVRPNSIPTQLPLLPSIYSRLMKPSSWRSIVQLILVRLLRRVVYREFSSFRPALRVDYSALSDFTFTQDRPDPNPSKFIFKTGTEDNLQLALKRCKEENVTLHGALCTVAYLAMAKTLSVDRESSLTPDSKLKFSIDVDYDMRKRVVESSSDDVGVNVSIATLKRLKEKGISLDRKFWDVARLCKSDTYAALTSFDHGLIMGCTQMITDDLNISIPESLFKVKGSILNDLNLSNIGRYPYETFFQVDDDSCLDIECIHVFNSQPFLSGSLTVYLLSVKYLSYSFEYKLIDSDATDFCNYFCQFSESIGSIASSVTLFDVLVRSTDLKSS